ncbi:hypothetical protein FA13DRAFT_1778888 [Coprinellus micaceus]|uniref:Uncharacterized protein n=1 Tax=Coprinellus micaceus TaxID=71717 RepID=A0A4Y7SLM3_COPMI|nr:hypothetical protein FA13DRAFT_1778888 [Coprinellus micaceus]
MTQFPTSMLAADISYRRQVGERWVCTGGWEGLRREATGMNVCGGELEVELGSASDMRLCETSLDSSNPETGRGVDETVYHNVVMRGAASGSPSFVQRQCPARPNLVHSVAVKEANADSDTSRLAGTRKLGPTKDPKSESAPPSSCLYGYRHRIGGPGARDGEVGVSLTTVVQIKLQVAGTGKGRSTITPPENRHYGGAGCTSFGSEVQGARYAGINTHILEQREWMQRVLPNIGAHHEWLSWESLWKISGIMRMASGVLNCPCCGMLNLSAIEGGR